MKQLTDRQLKNRFKRMYQEEFDDPNESFMDFLLDLIPRNILLKMLSKGNRFYYSIFHKYK
ncbi:MAG: hypothetical protein HFJ12_00575 [Bacilli bacterium]|nr:hypothetical protein [Bacilli bacterium]